MKNLLLRLRAVLTPNALVVLAALLLAMGGTGLFSNRSSDSIELRASRILSQVHGAGSVGVVIRTRKIMEQSGAMGTHIQEIPCAAIAVAQGADDPFVRQQLEQALCVLLGLPASAVDIVTGG